MNIMIKCENCDKEFSRRKAEINRSKRLGRKNYCGRKCASVNNIQNIPEQSRGPRPENLIANNRLDNNTKFRWYMKVVKQRQHEVDIDLEYLNTLWENQCGICPLSGVELELRDHRYKTKISTFSASLDRIDNSKGYVKGNVRFVSVMANYARNNFTDEELIEFCNAVTKYNR